MKDTFTIRTFLLSFIIVLIGCSPDAGLEKAVQNHDWTKAEKFLNEGADPNLVVDEDPILIEMVIYGKKDLISLAIQKGANVNAQDQWGDTSLIKAVSANKPDIVELLIENKADINSKGNMGQTALMHAASWGNPQLIKVLIENGAELNIQDDYGDTALHHAARLIKEEAIEVLINGGADPEIKADNGKTYLTYLKERTRYWLIRAEHDKGYYEFWYDTIEASIMWLKTYSDGMSNVFATPNEIMDNRWNYWRDFNLADGELLHITQYRRDLNYESDLYLRPDGTFTDILLFTDVNRKFINNGHWEVLEKNDSGP
jgi:hypothetical protein